MSCRIDATVAASGTRVCAGNTHTQHTTSVALILADLRAAITLALDERHDSPHRHVPPRFFPAARPSHLDAVYAGGVAEPGVDAKIVLRIVAAATAYLPHERSGARDDANARADGAAIRGRANEL